MKAGCPTSLLPGKIDYKQLTKVNPEAARLAVLEYLRTNGRNISQAASVFGISRSVVYNIPRKEKEGDLRDQPRTPRHQPGRTPPAVENKVIEVKNKTRLGPERLSRYLKQYEDIDLPVGTIRHILRRNKAVGWAEPTLPTWLWLVPVHQRPSTRRLWPGFWWA
jgi:transposase